MPSHALPGVRLKALAAFLFTALICGVSPASAAPEASPSPAKPATLTVDGLGKPTATLGGLWQFHLGDNPAWSATNVDDTAGQNGWEQLRVDQPWGAQGHPGY